MPLIFLTSLQTQIQRQRQRQTQRQTQTLTMNPIMKKRYQAYVASEKRRYQAYVAALRKVVEAAVAKEVASDKKMTRSMDKDLLRVAKQYIRVIA